jgi:SAM-dependent methyltransferase
MPQNLTAYYESIYKGRHNDFGVKWRKIGAVDKASNIRALCSPIPHASIMEIGCGDGAVLQELEDFGRVSGFEISESAVTACRTAGLSVEVFNGSNIPLPDGAIDLVILTHVVEHLENPRELLYEARRVGRFVFVEVPLEDTWKLGKDFVPNEIGHINFYSVKTIRQFVQTCGLTIESQKLSHSSPESYHYRLGALGFAAWSIKSLALVMPSLATKLWTYQLSLLAH